MKYCQKCGNELMDEAVVCPKCGCAQGKSVTGDDSNNIGWAILGFFVPIAGLILYLIWKDSEPLKAKSAGKGALISVIASAVISVVCVIISLGIGIFSAAIMMI